jgi:SsrA-binding protein
VDPLRNRKLLLHKKELRKITAATAGQGTTIVPLKAYLKHGYAKVLIGIAVGKHNYDKRETLKKRDQDREIARALKVR